MSKKISELGEASIPLNGSEDVVLNQSGSTFTANLSDIKTYVGSNVSLSGIPTLSGNNVFTGVDSFTQGYVALGSGASTRYIGTVSTNRGLFNTTVFSEFTTNTCILDGGASDSSYPYIDYGVLIGNEAGNGIGGGGVVTCSDVVAIGRSAGIGIGSSAVGTCSDIVAIGHSAGDGLGATGVDTDNVIVIGRLAGNGAGSAGGSIQNVIALGDGAGTDAGAGFEANCSESVFIGTNSGVNQLASKNTFIGDQTNTVTPTHGGCIALGHGAQPSAPNTIAIGSASTPLSTTTGTTMPGTYSKGLRIMVNGTYYTIPLIP